MKKVPMSHHNTTDVDDLKREIRWAKEALSIAENCATHHSIQDAHSETLPLEYQHLSEISPDELSDHVSRLENDLEQLQNGTWDTEEQ